MNFGDMAWRPRLRQVGFVPKGEEWRRWLPGLNSSAGERWVTEVELSLKERLQMYLASCRKNWEVRWFFRDADVYSIMHAEDLFKAVLHLPKPLAEMLDDERIPRTKYVHHFNPLFGPMPEFHGPLEESGLRPLEASLLPAPKGFLDVQPMVKHIENLPILSAFPDYIGVLKSLVELHPVEFCEKRFTLKPASPETFRKVDEMAKKSR